MESLVYFIMAFFFFILSYEFYFKKRISLLHGYHYHNVKVEDKNAYLKIYTYASLLIAFGFLLNAIIVLTSNWNTSLIALFITILGIGIMIYAQFKYNGGIF